MASLLRGHSLSESPRNRPIGVVAEPDLILPIPALNDVSQQLMRPPPAFGLPNGVLVDLAAVGQLGLFADDRGSLLDEFCDCHGPGVLGPNTPGQQYSVCF